MSESDWPICVTCHQFGPHEDGDGQHYCVLHFPIGRPLILGGRDFAAPLLTRDPERIWQAVVDVARGG